MEVGTGHAKATCIRAIAANFAVTDSKECQRIFRALLKSRLWYSDTDYNELITLLCQLVLITTVRTPSQ
jgi:hypothetical protein